MGDAKALYVEMNTNVFKNKTCKKYNVIFNSGNQFYAHLKIKNKTPHEIKTTTFLVFNVVTENNREIIKSTAVPVFDTGFFSKIGISQYWKSNFSRSDERN